MTRRSPVEPLAIVGIGCRFPGGADSPESLWQLLHDKVDAMVDIPPERWDWRRFYDPDPEAEGKTYVRQGGFLKERVDAFDAAFFGMSPREVQSLDPQQRLLLEVTWEALEDAGIPAESLRQSDTGVYVGGFCLDSKLIQMSPLNRRSIISHTATSATMVMLSNRVSYALDLQGPSMTVDTACSSSLVAFHLACESVRRGECDLALAGGVNVMLRPEYMIAMCKGGFLSPDARCKAFDKSANGYARGEGAGVVVIKTLSKALADGDPIYALVRGTGVNQDGRTSGITLPSRRAQERLIRSVYDAVGLDPASIRYVEAHGTGTQAGDPIEAASLGAVLAEGRPAGEPCWLGSIKTNIGHLEAAAGIAGVIKAALSLHHGVVPANLHFHEPNPEIDFERLALRVPQEAVRLPAGADVCAAVNSFGYGGTNAHAVLQSAPFTLPVAPPVTNSNKAPGRPVVLPLSARSDEALVQQAARWRDRLTDAGSELDVRDLVYTAGARRDHHARRLALTGRSASELAAACDAFARGVDAPHVVSGRVAPGTGDRRPVFVYTGMASQWWGMGQELFHADPVFQAAIAECDAGFSRLAGWSLADLFRSDESRLSLGGKPFGDAMSEPRFAQPGNFALQVGLTRMLRSHGVEPEAIVGHSVGEVAAAWASGAITLADALRLTYHRSNLQQRLAGLGTMMAVGLSTGQVEPLLEEVRGAVEIAAYNGPNSVTLAGERAGLERLAALFSRQGVFHRLLMVDVAYHCRQMDVLREEFRQVLDGLSGRTPTVPLHSTVTGEVVLAATHDPDYWWANVRQPVLFHQAAQRLAQDGHVHYLEIGPHPALGPAIYDTLRALDEGREPGLFAAQRRKEPEEETLLRTVSALYAAGSRIDWRLAAGHGRRHIALPTYPWQREVHWYEAVEGARDRKGTNEHPLLQVRTTAPEPEWESELARTFLPYLPDHRVQGSAVFPGAGYVEAGLAAAALLDRPAVLDEIVFHKMLITERTGRMRVRVDDAGGQFHVYSAGGGDADAWSKHASGKLVSAKSPPRRECIDLDALKNRCAAVIEAGELYAALRARGLEYGPGFQAVQTVWKGAGECLALLRLNEEATGPATRYHAHPALVDGAFQALLAAAGEVEGDRPMVPVRIRRAVLHAPVGTEAWAWSRITKRSNNRLEADILLCDPTGRVLAELFGLRCQALARPKAEGHPLAVWSHHYVWQPAEAVTAAEAVAVETVEAFEALEAVEAVAQVEPVGTSAEELGRWIVVGEQDATALRLINELERRGKRGLLISRDAKAVARVVEEDGEPAVEALVYMASTRAEPSSVDAATGLDDAHAIVRLVQSLTSRSFENWRRLAVVTRGGVPRIVPTDPPPHPSAGTLWGLGRVVATEHPRLRCTRVDLDPGDPTGSVDALVDELLSDSREDEVALRGGVRHVHRLVREEADREPPVMTQLEHSSCELLNESPGALDALVYREVPRRAPGPGEVEVRVRAVPINFKDVMKALGMLDRSYLEETYFGDTFGMECAGEVVAVGEGVTEYHVGDHVASADGGGCFRAYHTMSTRYMVPRPATCSFEESVCWINFVTAYYSLKEVAGLQPGERVLIHSASGGVGLAAVQIARWLGAEVLATAGSDEKRAYLRSIGIRHVMDSRSLGFAHDVMEQTDGLGVDAVLNSLAGEGLKRSLDVLAPYGRFVEIGKRDIAENSSLGMSIFDRNISVFGVDVDRMMVDRPVLFRRLLDEVWALLNDGTLKPLPTQSFDAAEVNDAFRLMARARHIGKVTVRMDEGLMPVRRAGGFSKVTADGTYLITGGFGGFGLEVARHLAREGARHLCLVGRSGAATDEAKQAVKEIEALGVSVIAAAVDVGDRSQLEALFAEIARNRPPLRGIFHAAMVLDDRVLLGQDEESFASVMRPKAAGAWHLHELSHALPLDCFVLFSSISAVIGNAGQANYAAANGFLDTLAHYRRALGLAATSINWGVFKDVGVVARNPEVERHLARLGVKGFGVDDALAAMTRVLARGASQVTVVDVDWDRWAASHMQGRDGLLPPRFSRVARTSTAQDGDTAASFLERLHTATEAARRELVERMLAQTVADVMHVSVDRVDVDLTLENMGIDSLMSVELVSALSRSLGVEVSQGLLMQGQPIRQIARNLLTVLEAKVPATVPATVPPAAQTGGAQSGTSSEVSQKDEAHAADAGAAPDVSAMSEAELDALIRELSGDSPDKGIPA